jgi:hypothetical protein
MKFKLILRYQGQQVEFTNLEYDEFHIMDEEYGLGEEINNSMIVEDFLENYDSEIERIPE